MGHSSFWSLLMTLICCAVAHTLPKKIYIYIIASKDGGVDNERS
jgi:hypothetical protein